MNRIQKMPGGHHEISVADLPTAAERSELEQRRNSLDWALRPGEPERALKAILRMFLAFPSVRLDEKSAMQTAAVYYDQVRQLPAWAIIRGCDACIGKATPFPPSAGELKSAAEAVCLAAWRELHELGAILNAAVFYPQSQNEREKVAAGFSKLLADLRWNEPFDKPRRSAPPTDPNLAAAQAIAAGLPDPRPTPALSREVRAKMGLPIDEERVEN